MSDGQRFTKRGFDLAFSLLGLLAVGWLILLCWIAATISTRMNGFFLQDRVGYKGRVFRIIKIRTMRPIAGMTTPVTTENDARITLLGAWMRRWKLDELPQLLNVLAGQMSFVGPRPDVAGFADRLTGTDRIVLSVRPGITGPATLVFRNEEELLARCSDPEEFNRRVIYPAKVKINRHYIENYSFRKELLFVAATLIPRLRLRTAYANLRDHQTSLAVPRVVSPPRTQPVASLVAEPARRG